MIKGMHTLFYTDQPDALRDFLRDKLGLAHSDVGKGWLIFDVSEGDIGVHPVRDGGTPSGTHAVSFYCDDIEKTVAELTERGVVFSDAITDQGWGLTIHFEMPGGVKTELYQPRYSKK